MPVMHTAIPCTGNTADQAVSTVHLQLGAAKHLTRPLTVIVELGSDMMGGWVDGWMDGWMTDLITTVDPKLIDHTV